MKPADNKDSQPSKKGYGKRPLWQWVLLYVVVGGIIYFLIYLIFFHNGSSGSSLSY